MITCRENWTFCQIKKIHPDRISNPEKEDMSGKNQTYGNPNLKHYEQSVSRTSGTAPVAKPGTTRIHNRGRKYSTF